MIKRTLFAATVLISSSAFSAGLCRDVFFDGLRFDSGKFASEKQDVTEDIPGMLSQILKMSTNTLNESISPKYTTEKGQITLGQELVDGWTLEFNYKRDARTSDPTYRLSDIQVVKPNGDALKLTKDPTTVDGHQFSKEHISLADLAEGKIKIPLGENLVNIEAPVLIRGALAKALDKWVFNIEFINRDKLRLSQEADLKKIKASAFIKSNLHYTREIIKKQSFKFALLGLAMYLYVQKDQVADYLFAKDPWPELLKNSGFSTLSIQEQRHLVHDWTLDMDLILPANTVSYNQNKKSYSMKSYNDVSQILKMTNDLKLVEKKLGGTTLTYIFQNGLLVDKNPQKILSVMNLKAEDSVSIVFLYPASKRMVYVTDGLMQEKEQDSFLTLAVDGEEDRDLYIQLKNTLSNLKQ